MCLGYFPFSSACSVLNLSGEASRTVLSAGLDLVLYFSDACTIYLNLRCSGKKKGYNPSDFFIDSQFSIVSVLLMLPSFSYQFELKTLYCFCYPPITKSLLLGSFKKQKHKKVLKFDMSNFLNLLWFERISLLMS